MEEYKRATIESYDVSAEEFSKRFQRVADNMKGYEFPRFIELLLGKRILNLGCGSGEHSVYFKEKGLEVISIDLSSEMIRLCKEKGLNAFVMDVEQLDFEKNSFDGIWAVTSLLHIPKIKLPKVIEKLHEILKKHGILYVCVKEGAGEQIINDKNAQTRRFFSLWKKEELLSYFKETFLLIEFKQVTMGKTTFLEFFFKPK